MARPAEPHGAAAPAAFVPPAEFDEYRLLRRLGHGAMGQVYLAQDTLLDRPVAIKFLLVERPGPRARERFLVEARAIARLQHPHIVAVYRAGEAAGFPYLVSEYLRGQGLDQVPRPLPSGEVRAIGVALARGLAAAHGRGVLHRDIKPANVMRCEDGAVKLLDFGLAKLLAEGATAAAAPSEPAPPERAGPAAPLPPENSALAETAPPHRPEPAAPLPPENSALAETAPPGAPGAALGAAPGPRGAALTGAGGVIGTPLYLAPELWRGEAATVRSDLYALGALLYELCAGRAPHRDVAAAELPAVAQGRDAAPLGSVAPGADARLCAVIDRCLARDPTLRPASAQELGDALEAAGASPAAAPAEPYRGLHPFEAEHGASFFGRGPAAAAVLELLRGAPLTVVAGDSGAGKSSLCRAGVLPRVQKGALGEERRWSVLTLLPGPRPLTSLADALGPLCDGELVALAREQPGAVGRALRRRMGEGEGLVLFVDQLEELCTQSDAAEAAIFAEVLGGLVARVPGVRLLCTARSDALTRLAALPGLGRALSGAIHVLRPLQPDELREAIVGPAQALGFTFESEDLVAALCQGAGQAGGLPLLQFALAELWAARDEERRLIPASALRAIGGVAGALARHGDAVLAGLIGPERAAARRVLTRLVSASGDRLRRGEAELGGAADRPVLEALVRGRLLVACETEGETAYMLAHEALVQGWGTLGRWLQEDEGRRAAAERLAHAAAEWRRLGGAGPLWGERQVAEVEAASLGPLPPDEAAFLQASRRELRRRRFRQRGLLLAAPLLLALAYGAVTLQARAQRERAIAAHLAKAEALLRQARAAAAAVEALRRRSLERFDRGERDEGERGWAEALRLGEEARGAYARAAAALEPAAEARAGRRLLSAILYERALQAERDHRPAERDQLLGWLARYDEDGALQRRWEAPARLALQGLPAGAALRLQRYEVRGGQRALSPPLPFAPPAPLPPGSYLLTVEAPGRPPLRHAALLRRGEELTLDVTPPAAVPEGFVYVPPGAFLYGSTAEESLRRDMLKAPPQHPVRTGAFLIARGEVTFAEWLAYLRALPAAERARRLPRVSGERGGLSLSLLPDGRYALALQPTTQRYAAAEGEPLVYPGRRLRQRQDWLRLPVSGVSWEDALAYLAWRRGESGVRVRLCSEVEWERAARGADDRLYPHGDLLLQDDANHDRTYGRDPLGFGPDEVGSHPLSDSPFGVADLAGNVWEWVRGTTGEVLIRGGSWYQEPLVSCATNRQVGEPTLRRIHIGLRLCADPP